MKRLTGTNKEIAELLYQEQLELSKENRDVERTIQAIIEDVKDCLLYTSLSSGSDPCCPTGLSSCELSLAECEEGDFWSLS